MREGLTFDIGLLQMDWGSVIPADAYMEVGGRAMQEQLPRQES